MTESGWTGRRVLVTGASGFIGARLAESLCARGAEVHAVFRSRAPAASPAGLAWHQVDLAEPGPAAALLARVRPAVVFHLASHVSGARGVEAVRPTLIDNLVTTVNLMTALVAGGSAAPGSGAAGPPRLILAGSMDEPDADAVAPVPCSPYAAAKWAAAGYARMFHALYSLPVAHARLFMVYGPGQRDLTKLVPYVALALLRGESAKLMAGTRAVDWIYVDDAVDGLIAVAERAPARGETIEIGTGERTSVRAVAERIAVHVGGVGALEFGAVAERAMEQERVAHTDATAAAIGWRAAVDLDTGLARTVAWYRAQPGR